MTAAVWLARACFVSLLGALAFLSLVSPESEMNVGQLTSWDKAIQFAGYFVLTRVKIMSFPSVPLIVLGAAILAHSAVIEATQPYFRRSHDFYDMIANMIGIVGALAPILVSSCPETVRSGRRQGLAVALSYDG